MATDVRRDTGRMGYYEEIEPYLIDVRAVARLLSCSPKHVRTMTSAGTLPAPIRLGDLVRWDRRAIEEWVRQQQET